MFTSYFDEDGREWQFKTGLDDCETIVLGQDVKNLRRVSTRSPGEQHLADDCYLAYSSPKPNQWLIIKDGIVRGLFDIKLPYERMIYEFEIEPPDPGLWTDAEWAEKAKRDYAWKWEQLKFDGETYNLSPEEKAAVAFSRAVRRQLREPGFTRQILGTMPLPQQEEDGS